MSTVISVLVSCVVSATSVVTAVANGEGATGRCAGSYVDQASSQVLGGWSMQVAFEQDAQEPSGFRAVKLSQRAVLVRRSDSPQVRQALDLQSLRIIKDTVALQPTSGFGIADTNRLVF